MRTSKRQLGLGAVLGLAGPALALSLIASTTPGIAAAAPVGAQAAAPVVEAVPHAGSFDVSLGASLGSSLAPTRSAAARRLAALRPAAPLLRPTRQDRATSAALRPLARSLRPTATQPTASRNTASTTAQTPGIDDYPYRSQSNYYATDRWGFTERQCVSFAAWRLAQQHRAISNADRWGSALSWDEAARRLGRTVTTRARVGAIAQWNADESGAYYGQGASTPNGRFQAGGWGHVAWVKAVYADGSALVEQYNMGGDRSYSVMRVKAPRYLVV